MADPSPQHNELPHFASINADTIEHELDNILSHNREQIATLLQQATPYCWDSFIEPLTTLDLRLNDFWSPIAHLHAVAASDALRKAYDRCLPKLSEYSTWLGQHRGLYQAFQQIKDSQAYNTLNIAQKTVIEHALRDFRLAGVALAAKDKAVYLDIRKQLSQLSTTFSDNVMDSTEAWSLCIDDDTQLTGLPDHIKQMLQEKAQAKKKKGWLIGLDFPSYHAIVTYADNRDLRKTLYEAYVTRASPLGPHDKQYDNSSNMQQIMSLRQKLAHLLGFPNYSHYSLATKMAPTPQEVLQFLNHLVDKARAFAEKDFSHLQNFAQEKGLSTSLQPWDIAYYSEKLKEQSFSFSDEDVRPYFPLKQVLKGLFTIVQKLYGLRIEEHPGIDVWHKDVCFFVIFDEADTLRGKFYLDLFAREHKRGGAWMDVCRSRRRVPDGLLQHPVAYITCNLTPPLKDEPALLNHDEVITLFHEFGHGLHHMLTKIDYPAVAGIEGVPWDAVELPSQFMEQWCWQKESLALIATHYQTKNPLPDALLDKLLAARQFQSGLFLVRQLEFSLFDFILHCEFNEQGKDSQIQNILDKVRARVAVIPVVDYNRFQHSFSHIFAGGYAAGYYSYLWAEVLASDAFSQFEEHGVLNATLGKRFMQAILEQGGSNDPMVLFNEFCGRKPQIDAFLRHHGLA